LSRSAPQLRRPATPQVAQRRATEGEQRQPQPGRFEQARGTAAQTCVGRGAIGATSTTGAPSVRRNSAGWALVDEIPRAGGTYPNAGGMEMVRHVRKLGLCLVAVFAIGALAAASASAAELEYATCVKATKVGKTYTGKFNNKTCTEANPKGEGKYESQPVGEETPFTSKSKGVTITVGAKVVKCKKSTGTGLYTSGPFTEAELTFSSCGVNGSKKEPCQTPASGAGIIKTSAFHTKLEYLNEAETQIGVLLQAFPFAEFTCGAESFELNGRAIGTVTNTSKGVTLSFAANAKNEETLKSFFVEGEELGPFTLFSEPGEVEGSLSIADEQGIKGVSAVSS
jgi:hypothetical protein